MILPPQPNKKKEEEKNRNQKEQKPQPWLGYNPYCYTNLVAIYCKWVMDPSKQ